MTDQNKALPAQGSEAHQQGEQSNSNNNQTMESLLKEQEAVMRLRINKKGRGIALALFIFPNTRQ